MHKTRRSFLKVTIAGLVSGFALIASGSHAQIPTSTGEGIVGQKKPLCRETIADEAREHELKLIKELEGSGVKITSEQKEMLVKNAIEDTISILGAQYQFID